MKEETLEKKEEIRTLARPRIGFWGTGWIGRHRMEAMVNTGKIDAAVIIEPDSQAAKKAQELAPDAAVVSSIEQIDLQDLDGIVIATPSALHAEQAIKAFESGLAVFCQKPLGRDGKETRMVVEAARKSDRLLGIDLSYRYVRCMQKIKSILDSGEIGKVFAVNLIFHNAYGPDKPWFYDPALSGGGCVIDLGIHLVDLVLWALNFPEIKECHSSLFAGGRLLDAGPCETVEDYADVHFRLSGDTLVSLACSWKLNAGMDAVIEASFYGTNGSLRLLNVNGSFYDFRAEKCKWTQCEVIDDKTDNWGVRAAEKWVHDLTKNLRFNSEAEHIISVADILDMIYNKK